MSLNQHILLPLSFGPLKFFVQSYIFLNQILSKYRFQIWSFTIFTFAVQQKFNAFFVKQTFFSSDLFKFWSLGYPGVRESGWQSHTCVKILPQVGVEVCSKFGVDWSGGSRVKESVLNI